MQLLEGDPSLVDVLSLQACGQFKGIRPSAGAARGWRPGPRRRRPAGAPRQGRPPLQDERAGEGAKGTPLGAGGVPRSAQQPSPGPRAGACELGMRPRGCGAAGAAAHTAAPRSRPPKASDWPPNPPSSAAKTGQVRRPPSRRVERIPRNEPRPASAAGWEDAPGLAGRAGSRGAGADPRVPAAPPLGPRSSESLSVGSGPGGGASGVPGRRGSESSPAHSGGRSGAGSRPFFARNRRPGLRKVGVPGVGECPHFRQQRLQDNLLGEGGAKRIADSLLPKNADLGVFDFHFHSPTPAPTHAPSPKTLKLQPYGAQGRGGGYLIHCRGGAREAGSGRAEEQPRGSPRSGTCAGSGHGVLSSSGWKKGCARTPPLGEPGWNETGEGRAGSLLGPSRGQCPVPTCQQAPSPPARLNSLGQTLAARPLQVH